MNDLNPTDAAIEAGDFCRIYSGDGSFTWQPAKDGILCATPKRVALYVVKKPKPKPKRRLRLTMQRYPYKSNPKTVQEPYRAVTTGVWQFAESIGMAVDRYISLGCGMRRRYYE